MARPKILLIEPPWYRLFGSSLQSYPRGLCFIAAFLEKQGLNVKVYNADFGTKCNHFYESYLIKNHHRYLENLKMSSSIWREIKNRINIEEPDIVGIGAKTAQFRSALNVAKIVKDVNPDATVIIGGPHATLRPQDFLEDYSDIVDIVVRGEGEITFYEIVKRIQNNRSYNDILGISYVSNSNVVHNKARPFIESLDLLPCPARHLLIDRELYPPNAFGGIIISRGCPYGCTYCCAPIIWGKKVRYRSPKSVVDEIRYLYHNYGTRRYFFEDDNFTLNIPLVKDICNMIIKSNINIKWGCLTRAKLITEDLIYLMKKAGLYIIEIGIESNNPKTLEIIRKGETLKDYIRAKKICDKYGILFAALCMFGFPWENEEDIFNTIDFAKSLNPFRIEYSFVTPYPSTLLYRYYEEHNLLPEDVEWSVFYHQSPEMLALAGYDSSLAKDIVRELDTYNAKKMLENLEYITEVS